MNFFNELFSPSGKISSKRVIGTCVLTIVMGCIIYLTISEGGSRAVEDLLQTAMILAAALLGISNITSIWKTGSISYNQKTEDREEIEEKPRNTEPAKPEKPNNPNKGNKKPKNSQKVTSINVTTKQVSED